MEEHTNDIPSTNGVMIPHVLKNEKAMFTFLQPGELFPHIALPLTVIFIDIFHCYSCNHYYSKQFEIDLHCHTPFHMHQHTHTMLHTIFLTHNIFLNSRRHIDSIKANSNFDWHFCVFCEVRQNRDRSPHSTHVPMRATYFDKLVKPQAQQQHTDPTICLSTTTVIPYTYIYVCGKHEMSKIGISKRVTTLTEVDLRKCNINSSYRFVLSRFFQKT